jgi:hypothetical protein
MRNNLSIKPSSFACSFMAANISDTSLNSIGNKVSPYVNLFLEVITNIIILMTTLPTRIKICMKTRHSCENYFIFHVLLKKIPFHLVMGLLEVDVKYHLIIFKVKYVDLIILDITLPVVASSFHKYYLHGIKNMVRYRI